jgi:hypothetical protein
MSRGEEFTPTTGKTLKDPSRLMQYHCKVPTRELGPERAHRLPWTASSKPDATRKRVRALTFLWRVRLSLLPSMHNSLPHRPNSSLRRHSSTHRLVTVPPHHQFSIHLVSGDVPARTLRSWSRPLFYTWTYYPSGIKSAPPPGRKIRH